MEKGYEFDDVLLVPRPSRIDSRDDPDISVDIGSLHLDIPIIASPMKGIVGVELIKEIGRLGGIGILHRFWNEEIYREGAIRELYNSEVNFGVAIGIDDYEILAPALALGAKLIVLDVANGYLNKVIQAVRFLRNYLNMHSLDTQLVVGNVVTLYGARKLKEAGADLVRVGIGNGSLCSTRSATGVGYPQFSAVRECSGRNLIYNELPILSSGIHNKPTITVHSDVIENIAPTICDGGIKTSGDMAKALAAGADLVMLGSPLAITHEAETTDVIYGMASSMLSNYMGKEIKSVEGRELPAPKQTCSLEFLINAFSYGLKSCMTYMDANNLSELKENAKWVITK